MSNWLKSRRIPIGYRYVIFRALLIGRSGPASANSLRRLSDKRHSPDRCCSNDMHEDGRFKGLLLSLLDLKVGRENASSMRSDSMKTDFGWMAFSVLNELCIQCQRKDKINELVRGYLKGQGINESWECSRNDTLTSRKTDTLHPFNTFSGLMSVPTRCLRVLDNHRIFVGR